MDARTREFQKLLRVSKTVHKMQENIVKSTLKLYRLKSSPYKLVRGKPIKPRTVEALSRPLTVMGMKKNERTELLRRLMEITETVHRMRDYLTKTQMEIYRRKSSPYEWKRDMPKKCAAVETVFFTYLEFEDMDTGH